ncbi:MAG: hypothetical protein JO322_00570 [Candidatus Eremiobacteraeota bacterium]|nr:hypothetical protein [Candidatus Eremiobacteraeota bacterium]
MSTENRHSITDEVEKGVKDVRDSAAAAIHHSAAEAERNRREVEGDTMTPGEKMASVADEAKERIKEGIDDTKKSVRDHT